MKSMAALAASLLLWPGIAAAAGVVVDGTVKAEGPVAALPPLKITKDATACGAEQAANEALVAGSDGAVRNVVVTLHPVKVASPAPAVPGRATLDQVGCLYRPHVQAVTVGSELTLVNSDRVLHNVHGNLGPVTVFNLAMPIKGQRLPTKVTRPGPVRLQCDAGHAWMNAWVYVTSDALFAVTDDKGHFSIADVPPGEYTVEYWHEPIDGKGPGVTKSVLLTVGSKPAHVEARLKL
ncbi:MAG TPA: carboxypeptidase regulatory-like domain-containing protein [Polyangia bacterium]|nr:carboxypeptidase regulatory-like domain-containing protein [Polyangia bacterium]